MDVSIQEIAEKFKEYDEYRIVYHLRPDGDCIGSSYALALALKSIGKKCDVVGSDNIPKVHRYMTDKIELDSLENPVYISVDTATPARSGKFSDKHFTFCIDHHDNEFDSVDYRYLEQDCGACAEIIYKLIKAMNVEITKEIAELLYTGLVTDTMCFRTTDTSIQSFETAAELSKTGINVSKIGKLNMFYKSKGRLKVESSLRDSFHFSCDDKILTGVITLNDLHTAGVQDTDLEGINSLVEQVEGVKIGVTVRELPNGKSRCSVRTVDNYSANEICKQRGGGGHFHAACCEINASPCSSRKIMENICKDYLLTH